MGATNKAKVLKLLLRDSEERTASFDFALPAPADAFVVVTPRKGAPLSKPNTLEKGAPDYSDIIQWQLSGDRSPEPLDVEVQLTSAIAPNAEILAGRAATTQREQQERDRLRTEQADLRARYGKRNALSPRAEHIAPVAPTPSPSKSRLGA